MRGHINSNMILTEQVFLVNIREESAKFIVVVHSVSVEGIIEIDTINFLIH